MTKTQVEVIREPDGADATKRVSLNIGGNWSSPNV
jgi:hypothetical protein